MSPMSICFRRRQYRLFLGWVKIWVEGRGDLVSNGRSLFEWIRFGGLRERGQGCVALREFGILRGGWWRRRNVGPGAWGPSGAGIAGSGPAQAALPGRPERDSLLGTDARQSAHAFVKRRPHQHGLFSGIAASLFGLSVGRVRPVAAV